MTDGMCHPRLRRLVTRPRFALRVCQSQICKDGARICLSGVDECRYVPLCLEFLALLQGCLLATCLGFVIGALLQRVNTGIRDNAFDRTLY